LFDQRGTDFRHIKKRELGSQDLRSSQTAKTDGW
jgi:hypothetical protein